jgi:hypothetical protein
MSTFKVLIEVATLAGKAAKWMTVNADNQRTAVKLAQNAARLAPKFAKGVATVVRAVK